MSTRITIAHHYYEMGMIDGRTWTNAQPTLPQVDRYENEIHAAAEQLSIPAGVEREFLYDYDLGFTHAYRVTAYQRTRSN